MVGKGVAPAIGIDLGTTYSCVGVWRHEQVEIIPNDQGNRTMPSCVAFTDVDCLIGEGATNQVARIPTCTVYDTKRLIGRRFNEAKVQEDMKLWPFKVIQGANNIPKIVVTHKGEEKEFSAQDVSSMILTKLKNIAEAYVGKSVKEAVITVPAYFNLSQREATKDAGHVAGLNVLQIVDEPTSAAIAYGLDMRRDISDETKVLIFDLGGGTFDVCLVTIYENGKIKVNAEGGDTHLGGQDFDNIMVDYFVQEFNKKHKTDISGNLKALGRLRVASERAKRALSSTVETTIEIDCLHQGLDFDMRISRSKFENLNADFFSKCINIVESCLTKAKMNTKDVDEVVLVGGSTRIPRVQQLLREFFNGKELRKSIHVDDAVAYGASLLVAKLCGEISEKVKNIELLNIVPLSFGVATKDGAFSVIIPRNTLIPAKMEHTYSTLHDNQSSFTFLVYQGERIRAKDNKLVGRLEISVPLAPKGKSKVKLVFSIDANGILICSAEEVNTSLKKMTRISKDEMMVSKEEIDKILKNVQKYKLEDEYYKKKLFARNALEEYIDSVESKIVTMFTSKDARGIWMGDLKKMKNAISRASQFLNRSELADASEYEKATNQLERILSSKLSGKISEKVTVQLSIGVATEGDAFSVIIPRNTPIPTTVEHIYSTHEDYDVCIRFPVYQGERVMAKDNIFLGRFEVTVPQEKKGISKVKVVFKIDANGVLICSGEDLTTGLTKQIIISNNELKFSREEIDNILNDVQEHKLIDNEYKKKLFARNELERYMDYVANEWDIVRFFFSASGVVDDHNLGMQLIETRACLARSTVQVEDVDVYKKEKSN